MTSLREDLVTVRFRRDGYEEATARLRDFLDDFERVAEMPVIAGWGDTFVQLGDGPEIRMNFIVAARKFVKKWGTK